MAELFEVKKAAISKHLKNIFLDGELQEQSVVSILETTAADGKRYKTNFYNLDAIIAVGYRVNSRKATQFRIWATNILHRYIVDGYAVNRKKIKIEHDKLLALQSLTHAEDPGISPVNCNTAADSGHSVDITYTVGGVSFTMKPIPAVANGLIGDNLDGDNKPHTVSLTAYRIGETQVTQELWQAVMGSNPSFFTDNPEGAEIQCKRPVECINWYCALAFCNKLSVVLGLEPCYTVIKDKKPIDFTALAVDAIPSSHDSDWDNAVLDMRKNGFRLPTEAEWEWSARGGATGDNSTWGIAEIEDALEEYAWTLETGDCKTHEVKKKKPNGYGVYDMIGNVWEWCWNWYDENTPAAGQTDPVGAANGTDRTFRGGCWGDDAYDATAAVRRGAKPEDDNFTIGFRLAARAV